MTRLSRHPAWFRSSPIGRRHRLLAFCGPTRLPLLLAWLALAWSGTASAEPASVTHEATDVPLRVPETGTAGAMKTSVLVVPEEDEVCGLPDATVRDVDVRIDLLHDFNADVTAWLTSPEGTTIPLFSRLGGGTTGMSVIIDDEAPEEVTGSVTDFTARRPQSSLAGPGLCRLDGQDPVGEWQLDVQDWLGGSTGYLSSWALTLTCDTAGQAAPCSHEPATPASADDDKGAQAPAPREATDGAPVADPPKESSETDGEEVP